MTKFEKIRLRAGLTVARAALYSGVSQPTIRRFEANPVAVSLAKRKVLAAYYDGLLEVQSAALDPNYEGVLKGRVVR